MKLAPVLLSPCLGLGLIAAVSVPAHAASAEGTEVIKGYLVTQVTKMAGLVFIGTIGMLLLFFGAKLPYRKLLIVTGVLVVSIMVTFIGSAVRLFQTVGWLPVHLLPGFNLPNWVGVWLGIYPSWESMLIPPLALFYVVGAWLYTKLTAQRAGEKYPISPPLPATVSRKKKAGPA